MATCLSAIPALSRAEVLSAIGKYCKDRVYDTMDLVRIRGGVPRDGKGIGAKARLTSLLQAGWVTFDGTYVGLEKRGLGVVHERRREAGVSLLYGSYNEMEPVVGNAFLRADDDWSAVQDRRILRNLPHWDDGRQRLLSVGAEVVTPILAIDAGVYPEEALDLVLGFFLIDIYRDDTVFGYNVPYHEGTTEPGPKFDAPFADVQARNAEFKKKFAPELPEQDTTTTSLRVPAETDRRKSESDDLITAEEAARVRQLIEKRERERAIRNAPIAPAAAPSTPPSPPAAPPPAAAPPPSEPPPPASTPEATPEPPPAVQDPPDQVPDQPGPAEDIPPTE